MCGYATAPFFNIFIIYIFEKIREMKRFLKWLLSNLNAVLAFLMLVIDRQILVLFPFVSSYSAQELKTKPDRFLGWVFFRVIIAVSIALVITIITLIF